MGFSKSLLRRAVDFIGPEKVYETAARARRRDLTAKLARLVDNRVQSGPFKGMWLPDLASWGDGDRAPKLLGIYEADLEPAISRARERHPAYVVNVGCAEGYYAVGLARLMPDAAVFAFDISSKAQAICRQAAALNGVGERVTLGGNCTAEILSQALRLPGKALVVVDIEGAERELLDPALVPELRRCDLIVEMHDFLAPEATEILMERFKDSHDVELIRQGGRDPHVIPELDHWTEAELWLLTDECRPMSMNWLACWAK
jgi:hypothetical protein